MSEPSSAAEPASAQAATASITQLRKPARSVFKSTLLIQNLRGASQFGSDVVLTLGCNIAIGLCALITGPLCARLLGPAGRGELAAIQNLYWLITTLAMLGLPEATLYFTARKIDDPRRILFTTSALCLLAFPLFYLASYPLIPLLLAAQSTRIIAIARWVLLGMPLYVFALLPQYSLRGQNDLLWWNIARILPTFGWLALLLILPHFARPTPGLFAFAYLGMFALALIPIYTITARKVQGKPNVAPSLWPGMLKYGIPLAASAIPIILNLRLDQMLLAAFMPAKVLGIYVVAVAWSATVPPALMAIGSVLFPRVASATREQRAQYFKQGTRLGMAVAILLASGIAMLTRIAIPILFGKSYLDAVPVSLVLVFAAAISGMNIIFEEGLRGLGQTKIVFWSEMVGLLATIGLLTALLRPLGIMGAGIASIVGYSVTFILLSFHANRTLGGSIADSLVLKAHDYHLIVEKLSTIRYRNGALKSIQE